MIKKKNLFFFVFFFYSTVSWAVVTGWYCGSCSIGNLAMTEATPYCESNPCDEACYYCGTETTNESVAITGGTRNWQQVCPSSTAIYCENGIPGMCAAV